MTLLVNDTQDQGAKATAGVLQTVERKHHTAEEVCRCAEIVQRKELGQRADRKNGDFKYIVTRYYRAAAWQRAASSKV